MFDINQLLNLSVTGWLGYGIVSVALLSLTATTYIVAKKYLLNLINGAPAVQATSVHGPHPVLVFLGAVFANRVSIHDASAELLHYDQCHSTARQFDFSSR